MLSVTFVRRDLQPDSADHVNALFPQLKLLINVVRRHLLVFVVPDGY
jgi:hypothetical protein